MNNFVQKLDFCLLCRGYLFFSLLKVFFKDLQNINIFLATCHRFKHNCKFLPLFSEIKILLYRYKTLTKMSAFKSFMPMFNRVLVRRFAPELKTKGGIVIPEANVGKVLEATVVATGPGNFLCLCYFLGN